MRNYDYASMNTRLRKGTRVEPTLEGLSFGIWAKCQPRIGVILSVKGEYCRVRRKGASRSGYYRRSFFQRTIE